MDSSKVSAAPESKLHFLDYWRIIRIRKTVIIAVFLLVVITTVAVTSIMDPIYASTAQIKIQRDQSDISEVSGNSSFAPGYYDPYFIQTEFSVIQSELVLGKVVKDLKLVEELKNITKQPQEAADAVSWLKGMTKLEAVRNTSLINITVYNQNAETAKRYANAIASAYREHRLEERKQMTLNAIKVLEDFVKEKEKDVRAAQKKVDDLRVELKIPDTVVNENAPTMLMSGDTLRKLEALRIESQGDLAAQDTLLNGLKKLTPEKLAQTLPTVTSDTLLVTYLEQLNLAEQELVSLGKEYGPEHSAVIKATAQVEQLNRKIKDRLDGALTAMETRVASLRDRLENLTREVKKAQDTDIEMAARSRPYFDAKRELQELQRFQQVLNMKILGEQTDIELPKTSVVKIVESAEAPRKAVKPNKVLNISLGVVIGLVVGIGLAFFIEYLDTSVKTIDDVERSLGSPVLGVIPQNVGLLIEEGAESPHAEAYRVLRTNLLFSRKDDKLNSVAVVSAGAGEGKSTTVFNLASVFAQSGQRVIVVDSDLRRPTLHKMLHVTNNLGLTNYLLKQNTLEEVIQTTNLPTLDFMASGKLPSSSLGILSSAQMKDLINELKQHYDFVFFDSPPVMGVSDASILASEVDMTIQVIQYRRYPQPMNIRAKQLIEKVGGNLIGIVLNNINMSQDESYYYYSGYYTEYYSKNEDQEPVEETRKS